MKRRATGLTVCAGLLSAAAVLALPSTALGARTRSASAAPQTFRTRRVRTRPHRTSRRSTSRTTMPETSFQVNVQPADVDPDI